MPKIVKKVPMEIQCKLTLRGDYPFFALFEQKNTFCKDTFWVNTASQSVTTKMCLSIQNNSLRACNGRMGGGEANFTWLLLYSTVGNGQKIKAKMSNGDYWSKFFKLNTRLTWRPLEPPGMWKNFVWEDQIWRKSAVPFPPRQALE